jgi:hypothetical protein
MTQDEAFLPYTINSSLPTQPLPASSLDGSVDTLTGNLRSRPRRSRRRESMHR